MKNRSQKYSILLSTAVILLLNMFIAQGQNHFGNIDLASAEARKETVTLLRNNADGTYTYFNELAIDKSGNPIENKGITINISGNVYYDGDKFTYVDENGNKQTINFKNIVEANETVTVLKDNGNSTYTYTSEDGSTTTIEVVDDVVVNIQNKGDIHNEIQKLIIDKSDVLTDNGDGTFTHKAVDGTKVTFDATRAAITDNEDGTYSIKDASGTTLTINTNANTSKYDSTTSGIKDSNNNPVTNVQTAIDVLTAMAGKSDALTDNLDGTFTHKAVDGTKVTFDATRAAITDNKDGTYNIKDASGSTVTINTNADTSTYNNATSGLKDSNNNPVTNVQTAIDVLTAMAGKSDALTDNLDGTFTHKAVDGTKVTFDATRAAITDNKDGTYNIKDASGSTVTINTNADTSTYNNATSGLKDSNNNPVTNVQTAIDVLTAMAGKSDALTDNLDGTFTHKAVDGTKVTFDATRAAITDNKDGTYNIKDASGSTVTINTNADTSTYNNATSGLKDSNNNPVTNVQTAIDVLTAMAGKSDALTDNLDGTFTHKAVDGTKVTFDATRAAITDNKDGTYNIKDTLGETVTINTNANTSKYNNSTSSLKDSNGNSVTNVQDAIDALVAKSGTINLIDENNGLVTLVKPDGTKATVKKSDLTYNDDGTYTFTNNDGTDVIIDTNADTSTYDSTSSGLKNSSNVAVTNVQGAIDALAAKNGTINLIDETNGLVTLVKPDGTKVTVKKSDLTNNNNDGTYTFTNNDGSDVTIVTATVVDNKDGTTTITDANGDTVKVDNDGVDNVNDADSDPMNEIQDAGGVTYSNTNSGLTATNTQAAIDELVSVQGNDKDGVIGNEILNGTTNGSLTRNGAGTTADPYTLDVSNGGINTTEIADNAVTASKVNADVAGTGIRKNATDGSLEIDPSTVTADGDITSTDLDVTNGTDAALNDVTLAIKDNAITSAKIANNAVNTSEIADKSVSLGKLSDGTANGQVIQWNGSKWVLVDNGSLTATEQDGVIGNEVLNGTANGSLTRNGAGTTADPYTLDVSNGGINTTEIADNAVTASKVNADVAGTGIRKNATDGSLEIDPSTVTADGDITSTDLDVTNGTDAALNDVTLAIKDNAITSAKIANNAVNTSEISDKAVSLGKLSDGTANGQVIQWNGSKWVLVDNGSLTATEQDGVIGNEILNGTTNGSLTRNGAGTTADPYTLDVSNGGINTTEIAANAVTASKVNADVAGTGIRKNTTDGSLEIDPSTVTADGDITSTDLDVTNGIDAALNDVTLAIKDNAITSAKIADNAVTSSEIANNAVNTSEIADKAVSLGKLSDGTANGQVIQWNGNKWVLVDDGSLTVTEQDGVIGNEILNGTTNGSLTRNGAGTTADPYTLDVTDGGINTTEIADNAVTASKVNADVAGTGIRKNTTDGSLEIDPSTVTADGDITSTDLDVTNGTDAALNDVTLAIKDNAITSAKIANNAVNTSEIATNAVTASKVNADVAGTGIRKNTTDGSLEIDPSTVTADGDITSTDLDVTNGIDAALNDVTLAIKDNAVTSAKIANNAVTSSEITDNAVTALKVNADVAGTGIRKNATDGSLEIDPSTVTADGDITSTDLDVTNGTDAALNDVTLAIKDNAVTASKVNADVAGTGIRKNATDGSLEIDPSTVTADGDITSTDLDVTNGIDAALNDVTLAIKDNAITSAKIANNAVTSSEITDNAVTASKVNADVAGTGIRKNATDGSLEIDPSTVTADGDITSTDLDVTNGTDAALNDVTLAIKDNAVTASKVNADVAGTGIRKNATDGSLEIDPSTVTADGDITSTDLDVTNGIDAALNDVTLAIKDNAITSAKIANNAVNTSEIADKAVSLGKLSDGTANGQVIQWNGSKWVLVDDGSLTVTEQDGVIGNEILNGTTNGSLTRNGAGTTADPYTLDVSNGGINTTEIADNAVTASKVNADVAGTGIRKNTTDGSLEIDPSTVTADGDITSTDLDVTNGTDAALNDVTLAIKDNAVTASKVNADVAGTGIRKNATDGSLEIDPSTVTADGDITSTDLDVTNGTDAALNDVTLAIKDNAITSAKIANNAVNTSEISDKAVSLGKLSDGTANGQLIQWNGTEWVLTTPKKEPWRVENKTNEATANTDNIYQSGNIGIGDFSAEAITESLDVKTGTVKIRQVNTKKGTLQAAAAGQKDRIMVASTNGTIKSLKAVMPKFFFMPSVLIPTSESQIPASDYNSTTGTYTINLYQKYINQFTGANANTVSNPSATEGIPVLPSNELEYHITWYDDTLFQNVSVTDAGVLTYKTINGAQASEGSFMNIVFVVKE